MTVIVFVFAVFADDRNVTKERSISSLLPIIILHICKSFM